MTKLQYYKKNWKLGVHLIFRTKRFGVNNELWSHFDAILGQPFWRIILNIILIRPIIINYQTMKFRATACHFVSDETKKTLGWLKGK